MNHFQFRISTSKMLHIYSRYHICKNFLKACFLILIVSNNVFSQCDVSIEKKHQIDLEIFAASLKEGGVCKCNSVSQLILTNYPNNPDQIHNLNLDGLDCLQVISGSLQITDLKISNQGKLTNLISVGNVYVANNHNLTNLDFQGINSNLENILIQNNSSLKYLDLPQSNIYEINSQLNIIQNPLLELNGLDKILKIGTSITITGTSGVESMIFSELIYMRERLYINGNSNLENFEINHLTNKKIEGISIINNLNLSNLLGPELVEEIESYLIIANNELDGTFTGFTNLESIEGILKINSTNTILPVFSKLNRIKKLELTYNQKVNNLNITLNNLDEISEDIYIEFNPNLSKCNISPICESLNNVTTHINANSGCCYNEIKVDEDCKNKCCDKITTTLFNNCNQIVIQSDSGICYKLQIDEQGEIETIRVPCKFD